MGTLKRRPAFLVLAIPVVLFLAVLYDQWRSDALPPPFLQFVPPNATAFVVAENLADAVENGGPHAGVFWPDASEDSWNTRFAEHCAGLRGAADLERYGFDGRRGAAAFQMEPSGIVLALPVADKGRAIDFLRSLAAPPSRMLLRAAPSAKPLQWLRVDSAEISGVRLCTGASPIPVELRGGSTIDVAATAGAADADRVAEFFVVRQSDEPASLKLQCVAVYADGSEGPCTCTLHNLPCEGSAPGALPAPVSVSPPEISRPVMRIGEDDPSYYLEASPGIGLMAFVGRAAEADGLPRPTDDLGPLVEALQVDRNMARFRNDDTYLRLLSEFGTRRRTGDVRVIASAGSIGGTTQIDASLLPDSVQLTMFTPLEQGGARIAELLMEPAPGPIAAKSTSLTGGNLTLWDEHTPDYLRYVRDYFPAQYDMLKEGIGTLSVFLDKLTDTKFSKIDVDLYGEKDGVPGLVIEIDMDAGDVDRYFSAIATEMQRSRSLRILEAAFWRANEDGKVSADSTITDLAPYLPGDQSLLSTYEMTVQVLVDLDGTESFLPPAFDRRGATDGAPEAVDFSLGETYEKAVFLSPSITEGDIQRLREGDDRSIDEAGLKEGRYRLIGLATGNNVILISNRATLEQYVAGLQAPAAAGNDIDSKLLIDADPDWLRTQLALYPDPEVREFAGSTLGDLAGYRRLLASTRPDARLGGFMSTVVLDYDD